MIFQSTFPLQGTTLLEKGLIILEKISIHVPIAGNDPIFILCDVAQYISIHVPIAGNDVPGLNPSSESSEYFNPRSHCRERRLYRCSLYPTTLFQSTFPLQGTTV